MMVGRVSESTGVLVAVATLVWEKNAKNAKYLWFRGVFLTFFGYLVPILSRNMLREGPKTWYTTRRTSWAVITKGATKKFGQVCSRCPKLGRICCFWKMINFRRLYLLNALTQIFQPVPKLSPEHSFIQPESGIDVLITIFIDILP